MGGPSTFSAIRTPFFIELEWAQKILINMKLMGIHMLLHPRKRNFDKGHIKVQKGQITVFLL